MSAAADRMIEELTARGPWTGDVERLLDTLHRRGLSIIEAIKVVRALCGIDLAGAKQRVAAHPAYRAVADAAAPLHDTMIEALEREASK